VILLDSHVLVRYMHDEGKLGKRTLSVIQVDDQRQRLLHSPLLADWHLPL
jgi:hypothetical protein